MLDKIKIKWPVFRFRGPLANPLRLEQLQRRLFGPKRVKRISWRTLAKISLWGAGALLLIIVFLFAWFAKDLPTPGKIRNLVSASSTRLFDRNLKPLYTISGEKKRIIIEEKDIPEVVKQATVALEDHQFYQHFGVDPRGVTRAVLFGGRRGGGSTITQQLARNTLLNKERTVVRKLKELILAIEMEALFSKEQILTMYLNEIPYGGNNYGIEAASRSFFGKSAKELTMAEAATLASLPQQPSTLSPYGQNLDKLIARRNFALDQMVELNYTSKEEAAAAKEVKQSFAPRRDSITAPHFVLFVKDWLVDYFTKELGDKQLAEQKVEEGGLTVVTTLDLDKQVIAEDILRNASEKTLKRAGASNAGLVALDPKLGEIIAMAGSVDYFQEQFGSFNVTTASRQPGSSFKPIVYAAAFKEKYNPAFTLYDLRTDFGKYEPDNFDGNFRGPVTVRQALGNSLNIPAVKILGLVGLDKALQTAHDLGITTLNDRDRYGLSLVLGGGEVRLLDMATAYGVFANNGVLMPTTPVLKITDTRKKEIYLRPDPKEGKTVLDRQIAYQISNILSDVEAKKPVFGRVLGTLTLNNRPAASKTGTTNAFRDAWTIGYTPQYVTAVWAGNNDNTSMNRAGGSVAAAPIWDEFMEKIHQGLPVENFSRPEGIKEVAVDRLSNRLPVEGSETIKDIFASWQVPTEPDNVHLKVRVCRENGLLADESIPNELAEDRVYTVVHSEKPDYPNWENPVVNWARSQGLDNPPPTGRCEITVAKPTIQIIKPANNSEVSGDFTIESQAEASSGIKTVEYLIDGISVATTYQSPFTATQSAKQLSLGSHTITAVLTTANGSTASALVTIVVSKDNEPPANITSFTGLPGPGLGKVSLSWVNPASADLKTVKILVYLDASALLQRTIEVSPPTSSVIISSLTSATAYRFVAKTVDLDNNESTGATIILTAP